jgi:MoxR-like ATPase
MHARWLSNVLCSGDSLLTPGVTIWTLEHLDELERYFIGQPDLRKDKRFLEKLHDQLAHASPEAIQLMAEIHVIHFLIIWTGAISAAKKLRDIEIILSWMPEPVPVPEAVVAVLSPGCVHPGQWVMTRRDVQLAWLIRFAIAWKHLDRNRQDALIQDPWELKAFIGTVHADGADSTQAALLYLAHPNTFESIVSVHHKRWIIDRFADVSGADDDIDRRLLAVRGALTAQYGTDFDWYADPLIHRWWKSQKTWPKFIDWLQRLHEVETVEQAERASTLQLAQMLSQARQQLFVTDSQWLTTLRSVFFDGTRKLSRRPVDDRFLSWLGQDHDEAASAMIDLWTSDTNPLSRLGNFLERVPLSVLGTLDERVGIGSFLIMNESPEQLPPVELRIFEKAWKLINWAPQSEDVRPAVAYERSMVLLDELVHASTAWSFPLRDRLDAECALLALVSCPKKPESWSEQMWVDFNQWRRSGDPEDKREPPRIEVEDDVEDQDLPGGEMPPHVDYIETAAKDLHVDRAVLDEIVELLDDKRQVVLYGPPGTGKTFLAVRLAKAIAEENPEQVSIVQFHSATTYEDFFEGLRPRVTDCGQVTYERSDGPLLVIAKAAESDPHRTYVLVIDEINRANLPKVFGELLFLLEYRNESARTLYRPNERFRLPSNLWLIGTMNTADRSVALIDAAMRRRFHFVPFFPHQGPMKGLLQRWLDEGGGRVGVSAFLDEVNKELLNLVGEHLLIGPSHFMKTDLSDKSLERIWTYNVFPMIEEQIWGNREEVDRWRWAAVRERLGRSLTATSAASADEALRRETEGDASEAP